MLPKSNSIYLQHEKVFLLFSSYADDGSFDIICCTTNNVAQEKKLRSWIHLSSIHVTIILLLSVLTLGKHLIYIVYYMPPYLNTHTFWNQYQKSLNMNSLRTIISLYWIISENILRLFMIIIMANISIYIPTYIYLPTKYIVIYRWRKFC